MYSWNTIRTICAVLLIVPIVHLAYLVSSNMLMTLDASPEAWAAEVDAYTRQDQATQQLPSDPVVVIGGQRVKLWPDLDNLLAPLPLLKRGLGDATVDDITHYYSQLVGFYQPSYVVLLPSNSEFHIRDSKSGKELADAIIKLVNLDQSYQITRQFFVFTPIKTPLYNSDYKTIDETTRLLRQWAQSEHGVTLLDANPLLAMKDGKPNPDYFRMDGVDLNEHGYLRLSVLLRNQIAELQNDNQAGAPHRN